MLNSTRLGMMKKGAILVNTCRGELVDEDALVDCLTSGHLRGYGTDVVEGEPIDGNHRLLRIPGVVVLPHLGGYSLESLRGMGDTMVRDCVSVFVERVPPKRVFNGAVVGSPHFRRWQ
jgi:phosphoglycerate dehydrogenase-like enzyme